MTGGPSRLMETSYKRDDSMPKVVGGLLLPDNTMPPSFSPTMADKVLVAKCAFHTSICRICVDSRLPRMILPGSR